MPMVESFEQLTKYMETAMSGNVSSEYLQMQKDGMRLHQEVMKIPFIDQQIEGMFSLIYQQTGSTQDGFMWALRSIFLTGFMLGVEFCRVRVEDESLKKLLGSVTEE